MKRQLEGQVAVVTGGGSGIGAAIATLFALEGADVVVLDQDIEHAQSTTRECEVSGARTIALGVDVTDGAAVRASMDRVASELGGIDVLVNAAGILEETPLLEMSERTFDKVLSVDLKGVFLSVRWAAPTWWHGEEVASSILHRSSGSKAAQVWLTMSQRRQE